MFNITFYQALCFLALLYLGYRIGRWFVVKVVGGYFEAVALRERIEKLEKRVHGKEGYYDAGWLGEFKVPTVENKIENLQKQVAHLQLKVNPDLSNKIKEGIEEGIKAYADKQKIKPENAGTENKD